ncbi:hypothetical protein OIO90_005684 [Microbotryomycetes sp. JL221]|nr:hypothetical protein OIO90_005684 [Microbotryomycetes sp. JL221]
MGQQDDKIAAMDASSSSSNNGRALNEDKATRPSMHRKHSSSFTVSMTGRTLRQTRTVHKHILRRVVIPIAALLALCSIYTTIKSLRLRSARNAARSSRKLMGFTDRQLERVPANLRPEAPALGVEALLSHPLMAEHPSPSCRLNEYQLERYAPLEPSYGRGRSSPNASAPHYKPRHQIKYLVAINLFDSEYVLPTLIRVFYRVFVALGPERFHVSIYENGSNDSTPGQLWLLAQLLDRIGVGYTINSDGERKAGWKENKRIVGLSGVRNAALEPLYSAPIGTFDRIIFINDVHLCEADLYELMLQHEVQSADMSCGMDFKELRIPEFEKSGYPLLFYDVWVARDMLGLPFYNIKRPSGEWVLPSPVMPNSPYRKQYEDRKPFQVFSCFNGVTVLDAWLFLPPFNLRFHSEGDESDTTSECYILCSDIWKALAPWGLDGHPRKNARGARIQIVPRASVGYQTWEYEKARQDRNTTAFELEGQALEQAHREEMIEWQRWPPRLIQNYPYAKWHMQTEQPPF